jgi:hypothetical protein
MLSFVLSKRKIMSNHPNKTKDGHHPDIAAHLPDTVKHLHELALKAIIQIEISKNLLEDTKDTITKRSQEQDSPNNNSSSSNTDCKDSEPSGDMIDGCILQIPEPLAISRHESLTSLKDLIESTKAPLSNEDRDKLIADFLASSDTKK